MQDDQRREEQDPTANQEEQDTAKGADHGCASGLVSSRQVTMSSRAAWETAS